MSDTIWNDQVDLHWEKPNGRGRGRRRGHLDEEFSAAVGEFRSQLQLNRVAKQEEKKQIEAKQKETDDNLKAVLNKIVELEEMAAFCRDTASKDADKVQVDTEQADKHDTVFEYIDSRVEELGEKTQDDIAALKTQHKDLSDKCNVLEASEGDIKKDIEANKKLCNELRGRIYVFENSIPAGQVKATNSVAVATSVAGTEQAQAKTRGYDLKKLGALTTKTKAHDQQIERLEMAMSEIIPKMEKAFEWHDWAGKRFEEYDSYLSRDIPDISKEIQAAKDQQSQHFTEALTNQKELFEQQLRQQKEASDRQLSDYKESFQEGMRLHEASIRKECEERLASKDREVAERLAKIDAEHNEQKERNDNLEKTMKDMIAQFNAQTAIQQSPSPAQGQPAAQAHPLQPTPASHGNGPSWSSTPTLPGQGGQQSVSRPDVHMGVPDLDDMMMEAPPLNPQQPCLQLPPQSAQPKFGPLEDTPMENGEPMIPNNNGNVGFLPSPQPMGGTQFFSGIGPAQPPPNAPITSAAPAHGLMSPICISPIATGFGPPTPASTVSATPTDEHGARLQRSLFEYGASGRKILAGKMQLPNLTATPPRALTPQRLESNTPPPTVNKPQVTFPSSMDLDDDSSVSLTAKAKQPMTNPAAATPASKETVNTGSSTPAKPQAPAATKPPASKPKKKFNLFINRNPKATPPKAASPKATPSKSNNLTSNVQTEETEKPAELTPAEKKQQFNAGDFSECPPILPPGKNVPKKREPAPPGPRSYRLRIPSPEPRTSPLANPAAVSASIAALSTKNIFAKQVEQPSEAKVETGNAAAGVTQPAQPTDNPGDTQMSEAEEKPETATPLKYEVDVNPRKHAAAAQIVPQEEAKTVKRETQDDAKAHKGGSRGDAQVETRNSQDDAMAGNNESQDDDRMDTDRRVAKPKGKAASMTAADRQRETQKFQQEAAWDAMEKAFASSAASKEKAAAAAADDEVDYGDPNDANDEDLTTTTMAAPLPKVRPTKYSIAFYNEWRQHFMSTNSLSSKAASFECRTKEDFDAFANEVQKFDIINDLSELLERAALPLKKTQGYTRYEMEKLIFTFREWVYFEALRTLDLDEMDEDFVLTNERFRGEIVSWFHSHSPDTV